MIAAEFATEMRTITRHIRREWYRRNSNWVLAFGPSPFSVADGPSSSADAILVPKPQTFKLQARAVKCQAGTAAFACSGGPAIKDRQLAGTAAFACGGGPATKDRQLFSTWIVFEISSRNCSLKRRTGYKTSAIACSIFFTKKGHPLGRRVECGKMCSMEDCCHVAR